MAVAVITEKYLDGAVRTLRSTSVPPPPEMEDGARELDEFLVKRLPNIERKLVKKGLLDETLAGLGKPKPKGNAELWYELGLELAKICRKWSIKSHRERRWLWEAIENIHATERIKRVRRERTRLHFEYCYRLARFPRELALRLNWSEWVYFFDSPTVREETRVDKWLSQKATRSRNIDRTFFRRFAQNLNKRIKGKDTSVFTDDELFQLYTQVWTATRKELQKSSAR